MKTSTILICSSLAAAFVADAREMQTNLKGAVQAATSDEYYSLERNPSVEKDNYVALSDDASYTYQFRMDLSTPLSMDLFDGTAAIDKCIGWDIGVSPTNFTWYGISFQLPVDAKGRGGGWNTAPAQPLKEDGYEQPFTLQPFNDTAEGVAKLNFTTSADHPVIRARINNVLFWDTFTFDFPDGSNYAEQQLQQSVSCITRESEDGTSRTYTAVVNPILTVSLELLSAPSAPEPEPSSSAMAGTFFAIAVLASSAFVLL
mmetsp:Transcript_9263/g.13996  ORF Transcript_9263/g.13996 Transcript_9263/m.13996 type:complete len:259 (+) Transcript_9263:68-844(+)